MAKDEIVDVEETAKAGGDNFMTGVIVFTSVALFVAFVLIEMAWKVYDRGLFAGS
jgi:hypothetical protein